MRTGQTRRIMKLCSLFSIFLSWLIFLVNCLEFCANIAKVLKFSKFLLYLRSFICSWIITYYVFSYLTIWSAILFVPFWWVLTGEWPNLLCSKCQRIDENCNKYFLCFFQWLKTLQIIHTFHIYCCPCDKIWIRNDVKILSFCRGRGPFWVFCFLSSWVSFRIFWAFLWVLLCIIWIHYINWGFLGFSTSDHIIWNNL